MLTVVIPPPPPDGPEDVLIRFTREDANLLSYLVGWDSTIPTALNHNPDTGKLGKFMRRAKVALVNAGFSGVVTQKYR